jgi:hypothetical protein
MDAIMKSEKRRSSPARHVALTVVEVPRLAAAKAGGLFKRHAST